MIAFKFTGDSLEGGQPLPGFGETVYAPPPVKPGVAGLHACPEVFDALTYARGSILHLLEASGQLVTHRGQCVSTQQRFLGRHDASQLLDTFARWCATQALTIWEAPSCVWAFLEGDEAQRDAARMIAFQSVHAETGALKAVIRLVAQIAAPMEMQAEPWLLAQNAVWTHALAVSAGLDGMAWQRAKDVAEAQQRWELTGLVGRHMAPVIAAKEVMS